MKQVRALCDEKDILLILDEIQCGVGRTGTMYAWQRYGVKPDIMTSAKAIGCGVPVGAFMMTEKVAQQSLGKRRPRNDLRRQSACVCGDCKGALISLRSRIFLANVNETGAYLYEKLDALAAKYDQIKGTGASV